MRFYTKNIFLFSVLLSINTTHALEVDVLQQQSNGNNIAMTCTIDSYDRVSKSILNTSLVKGFDHCNSVSADKIVNFQSSFIGLSDETNVFIELEGIEPELKFRVHNSDANLDQIIITDIDILERSVIPLEFENSERNDCDPNHSGYVVECGGQVQVITPASSGIITDLPGCIGRPTERQRECRGGTFVKGDVIAMRLDYTTAFPNVEGVLGNNGLPLTDIYPVRLENESNMVDAERSHYSFIMAISEIPGDFLPEQSGCRSLRGSTGFTISVTDENSETAQGKNDFITPNQVCALTEGKFYYINAMPLGGTTDRCGMPGIRLDGTEIITLVDGTTMEQVIQTPVSNACRYELITFLPIR